MKRDRDQVIERFRRFLEREMQDQILAELPVHQDCSKEWAEYERKWGYKDGEERPTPTKEEMFERARIELLERRDVEDDSLPVV